MSPTTIQSSAIFAGDETFVTVFAPGFDVETIGNTHAKFKEIVALLAKATTGEDVDPQDVYDLIDRGRVVAQKFENLSERVSVRGGIIYFDGDEVDNSLTRQVVRFLEEGVEDFKPLVSFFEKVSTNPNNHSRQQLFDWLNVRQGISITESGNIVAYKGVYSDGNGGYQSGHQGHAIRNGEDIRGYVPNAEGDTIEMPRSEVAFDPAQACKQGLHVGTYEYARGYANGAMLKVIVDPRDVVSVPTDGGGEKIRVCRYRVEEIIDAPETAGLVSSVYDWEDDDTLGDGDNESADLYFED